jgi:hypothetical protein
MAGRIHTRCAWKPRSLAAWKNKTPPGWHWVACATPLGPADGRRVSFFRITFFEMPIMLRAFAQVAFSDAPFAHVTCRTWRATAAACLDTPPTARWTRCIDARGAREIRAMECSRCLSRLKRERR